MVKHSRLNPEARKFLELIPPEHSKEALGFVERFSKGGQPHIARLLGYAAEEKRLPRALHVLERFWRFHWSYQDKKSSGDPEKNKINEEYLKRAYRELNIKTPKDRGE